MKIIQTFWSGGESPLRKSYGWPHAEFNLMSWALSCCSLREHYNEVELFTDQRGYDVLIGKLQLPYTRVHVVYDDGLCLPHHWAFAKIMTYSMQNEPFLHVDGDVYFPRAISEKVLSAPLITQNREIGTGYYRSMMDRVLRHPEICLPDCIRNSLGSSEISSYNMGIFGGCDLPFIKEFCDNAINFVQNNNLNDPKREYAWEECNILFEQVLFAVMADNDGRTVATIGRPMYDEGYTGSEFCNLTDYGNKSFFHILGGHKGSKAVCYALERVMLTRYREMFLRIAGLFPERHPGLFLSQATRFSPLEGLDSVENGFVRFIGEQDGKMKRLDRDDILAQEIRNAMFFEFSNQNKTDQQRCIIQLNPLYSIYDFTQHEIDMGMVDIRRWFTRQQRRGCTPCAAVILPGIDKYRTKVIPVSRLGRNVITVLKSLMACTYGDVRRYLWRSCSCRLRRWPKTLKKYILAEILYLAYNGIVSIQQPTK